MDGGVHRHGGERLLVVAEGLHGVEDALAADALGVLDRADVVGGHVDHHVLGVVGLVVGENTEQRVDQALLVVRGPVGTDATGDGTDRVLERELTGQVHGAPALIASGGTERLQLGLDLRRGGVHGGIVGAVIGLANAELAEVGELAEVTALGDLSLDERVRHGNAGSEEAVQRELALLNATTEGERIIDVRDLDDCHGSG